MQRDADFVDYRIGFPGEQTPSIANAGPQQKQAEQAQWDRYDSFGPDAALLFEARPIKVVRRKAGKAYNRHRAGQNHHNCVINPSTEIDGYRLQQLI